MAILLRFRPRPGMDIDPALDRRFDQKEIRIGRAPDNDVALRDSGLRFHHAALVQDETGVLVCGAEESRLDRAGDRVMLGRCSLTLVSQDTEGTVLVLEPGNGDDDSGASLTAAYLAALELPHLPVLRWSMALVLAVLVLGFLVPWAATLLPTDRTIAAVAPKALRPSFLWEVGTLSGPHAGFGHDCGLCHETPFVPVRSSACLACHRGTGQHADPHQVPDIDVAVMRCETCHHEHKGDVQAIRADQRFCADCHSAIRRQFLASTLADVSDFGRDHPEFAPTLVTDAASGATRRVPLGSAASAPDGSNLRFTHAKHLAATGIKAPDGNRVLHCPDCHVPDASGAQMQPVKMERDCLACHQLQFEPLHPDWHLPHGQPQEVASRVLGFYSSAILAGERFEPEQDALFAKPGTTPVPAELPEAAARSAAASALASSIARASCGECHATAPPAPGADPLAWTVLPVRVPASFMKLARFDHSRHTSLPCQSCHAAETSDGGPEALLPGIATCRQCHAGEAGAAQKIASPCVSCHVYHRAELPVAALGGAGK